MKAGVVCLALLALVALAGCGGSSGTPGQGSPSPSPSPAAVDRPAKPGETLALQSGLTVTVPAGYQGSYVMNARGDLIDGLVADHVQAPTFSSVATEHGEMFAWPLVTKSADQTVEVRNAVAGGMATTSVVVRLPDHPIGLVVFARHAAQSSTDSQAVMAQVQAVWRRFDVKGVSLSALER